MASSDASTLVEISAESRIYVYDRRKDHTECEKIFEWTNVSKYCDFLSAIKEVSIQACNIAHYLRTKL